MPAVDTSVAQGRSTSQFCFPVTCNFQRQASIWRLLQLAAAWMQHVAACQLLLLSLGLMVLVGNSTMKSLPAQVHHAASRYLFSRAGPTSNRSQRSSRLGGGGGEGGGGGFGSSLRMSGLDN